MLKKCCFTGHRKLKITQDLKDRLNNVLENLIGQGAEDFYAGGAVGWDTLCELEVIRLREKYANIRLNLVLPCSSDEQTKGWSEYDKKQYYEILGKANSIEYVSDNYFRGCMKKRNARLIEYAGCCICYCKEKSSGTGQTIRMAEEKNIQIINLYDKK